MSKAEELLTLTGCPKCGGAVSRGDCTFDVQVGLQLVPITGCYLQCRDCHEVYFAPGEMDGARMKALEQLDTRNKTMASVLRRRTALTPEEP